MLSTNYRLKLEFICGRIAKGVSELEEKIMDSWRRL